MIIYNSIYPFFCLKIWALELLIVSLKLTYTGMGYKFERILQYIYIVYYTRIKDKKHTYKMFVRQ